MVPEKTITPSLLQRAILYDQVDTYNFNLHTVEIFLSNSRHWTYRKEQTSKSKKKKKQIFMKKRLPSNKSAENVDSHSEKEK